jgi:uncharacterized protein YfdQ (DUF2303 family)
MTKQFNSGVGVASDGLIDQVRDWVENAPLVEVMDVTDPLSGTTAPLLIEQGVARVVPVASFDGYLKAPRARKGIAKLTDLDSFIDHANRFKDSDSVLFACDDRAAPSLTAVLNYHVSGATSAPRFGDHRSLFSFPLSDEWTAWQKSDATPMDMSDFAAFLEDRIIDVIDLIPDEDEVSEELQKFINICGGSIAGPSKLIEISRGLKFNEDNIVKEARNLQTGEAQIQFESRHVNEKGEELKVPGLFLIAIPIFKHGPVYRIAARLRYRKGAGGLVFFYELWRADRSFDHAFRESIDRAAIETDLPLMLGSPE